MAGFFFAILLLLTMPAKAFDGPPGPGPARAPGMEKPFLNPMDFKFTFVDSQKIFKDEKEALEYQALFDSNKDSKEVKDFFADRLRPRPDRETDKISMARDLKAILDKKKTIVETAKCEAGKSPAILEKASTDSMKETTKIIKVVMTEDELAKMKEEIKKEVMAEMKKKSSEERPSFEKREKPEMKTEDKPERNNLKMSSNQKRGNFGGGGAPMGGESSSQNNPFGSINMNNLASYFGGGQGQGQMQMQMGQSQNLMPTQMNQYQMTQQTRPMNMNMNTNMNMNSNMMASRQMPMQLNNYMNYNYNNQYNQMYGQNQNYFNPYSSYQYQMQPYRMGR